MLFLIGEKLNVIVWATSPQSYVKDFTEIWFHLAKVLCDKTFKWQSTWPITLFQNFCKIFAFEFNGELLEWYTEVLVLTQNNLN